MRTDTITALIGLSLMFVSVFLLCYLYSLYEDRRRKKLLFLTVYYVMCLTAFVPPKYQPAMLRHCPYTPYLSSAFLICQHFLSLSSSTFTNPIKELLSYKHLFYVSDREIKRLEHKLHLNAVEDDI